MNLRQTLIKILQVICVVIFCVITFVGIYQVFTRYFLNSPKPWSEEVLSFGFTWMALLGAALVFGKREHMRLVFILDKLSYKNRKIFEVISELFVLLFSTTVLIYGGIKLYYLTRFQITPALQISTGNLYLVMPIAGILINIFTLYNIIDIKNDKIDFAEEEKIDNYGINDKEGRL